jgi:peroxiredoxin
MSKAARLRASRPGRGAPVVDGRRGSGRGRTTAIWAVTAGLAVVLAVVVGALLATRSGSSPPPPAAPSSADENAPAALVAAAAAVGFEPATVAGAGVLESMPASAARAPSNPSLLPVGAKAPLFALRTPEGETVRLADYRGKAVLLEFFTTWCPHCNAEVPFLIDLYGSLPKGPYAFLSVNGDGEDAASVFAYHRYFGAPFPALLDPSSQPGSFHQPGAPGKVTTAYRVTTYPTFYVVDPEGRIAWSGDGEQPDALLRLELARAAARG